MSSSIAGDVLVGRPKKWKGPTSQLSVVLPKELREHLQEKHPVLTDAIVEAIQFSSEMDDLLEDVISDLRISAARDDKDYGESRAETLARLVRLGLDAETKRSKK